MKPTLDERIEKLLSKTEALVLLTNKASGYWSMVKFAFNIPLVLTSSAMCIINSISQDANEVKVPNIVVNAISVLIMSLNNSIKASEKCDLFRRLSQQLLLLTGKIENDDIIDENELFDIPPFVVPVLVVLLSVALLLSVCGRRCELHPFSCKGKCLSLKLSATCNLYRLGISLNSISFTRFS